MRCLLIANRGEIACRIIRTARAMGLRTVAVYSDPDHDAPHVVDADVAVPIGGAAPAESYLRNAALVDAARLAGADAVHPGYGFLAENASFAQACLDAGLTFVGPSPSAIAAMGDKRRAKDLLAAAGVPTLPAYEPDAVPDEAYPVLVKATVGGGGKGMRVVAHRDGLGDAVAAAQREAGRAFGDDRVFVERWIARPRHVEVQILGDAFGTVVTLGERECSIQRRHQKVIEESPSPAVDGALRARLADAAVAAGNVLSYTNAGTVEFLLAPDGTFFFLEVNTRLQVEHPVTELAWSAGAEPLDLVRLQLLVAQGAPLPFAQNDVALRGWAVEARLYAEDAGNDYLPATGTLAVWAPPSLPGVRIDSGVRAGTEVGVHYDPLLAKVIAAAPTRGEAALLLARALEATRIHGVTTNRDLLVATLRHPAFLAGEVHTGFLDEHTPGPERDPEAAWVHAAAAALAAAHERAAARPVQATIPLGWRNNRSAPQGVDFEPGIAVRYWRERDGSFRVDVDGDERVVIVHARSDDGLDLEVGRRRLFVSVALCGDAAYVDSPLGAAALVERPRFPRAAPPDVAGGLLAPMPGTVAAVAVAAGDEVEQGALLVTLEAMKMEHRITAPHGGTVAEVRVTTGEVVAAGAVLVVLS
jgi:propionyl-CoA carboxylase alpha chain